MQVNRAHDSQIAFGADLFGFGAEELTQGVTRYTSGVLSPAIWTGFRQANSPMCVAASEMGSGAVERACSYVRAGGLLLVDSGAFVYRNKPEAMPWAKVLDIYREIAGAANVLVTFMLPDSVGSQTDSLDALAAWGPALQEAIGHHTGLLPVQVGDMVSSEYVSAALAVLDRPIGGLAIPSNAAAFPLENLSELADVPACVPRRVHFLGISRNSHGLQSRIFRLREFWPAVEISSDACTHRSQVGRGRPITVARAAALEIAMDAALDAWDETEETTEDIEAALREQFPDADDEAISNMLCSQWGSAIGLQQMQSRTTKVIGPQATTASIYAFATQGLE